MELTSLKDCYRIDRAWRDLGLPGQPGKCVPSPFREDRSPSFSVFDEWRQWKDHATGESGSVIDFVMKARGCDLAEAIRFIEGRLGIPGPERKPDAAKKYGAKIPPLRPGTSEEHRELTARRGFNVEALRLAEQHGFLWFTTLWGHAAWCVTDARRALYEFRRLDGDKWPTYGRLSERKSHAYGSKRWPLGVLESQPFPKIVMVEGAPDLLATFHFIVIEEKEKVVAPVAVLGAGNHHLAAESLAYLAGKHVCIFPHTDDSGRKGMRAWARQLKDAGASRVTAFDLSGLVLVDGRTGKDLADVCRISADCLERERKFAEVLPRMTQPANICPTRETNRTTNRNQKRQRVPHRSAPVNLTRWPTEAPTRNWPMPANPDPANSCRTRKNRPRR